MCVDNRSIQMGINILFFPANALESIAYGSPTTNLSRYIADHSCLRTVIQRIVALVAPFFHLYECGIHIARIPLHLLTFYCDDYNTLTDLLFNKEGGAIICALNSLRECLSSICEMPQKLICTFDPLLNNSPNYFGRDSHLRYSLMAEKILEGGRKGNEAP